MMKQIFHFLIILVFIYKQVDNAKDLDVVMLQYNTIKDSDLFILIQKYQDDPLIMIILKMLIKILGSN